MVRALRYSRVVEFLLRVLPGLFGAAIEVLELFKKQRSTVEVVTAFVIERREKMGLGEKVAEARTHLQLKCGR